MINTIFDNQLLGYDNLFSNFSSLCIEGKFPKKIILSGKKGIGKSNFSKRFVNFLLTTDFLQSNISLSYDEFTKLPFSLNRHLNQNFYNIEVKENKKFIEVDQIRDLISFAQKKSFNNLPRFILIDNADKLNLNSSNSLLKILEEPNDNMFFILIHDNQHKILETINSRCINFNVYFSYEKTLEIVNKILNLNICDYLNDDYLNSYFSIGEILFLYNYSQIINLELKKKDLKEFINYIIFEKKYKTDPNVLSMTMRLIEVLFYKNFIQTKNIKFYDLYKNYTYKFSNTIKYNLDLEIFFLDFKNVALNE